MKRSNLAILLFSFLLVLGGYAEPVTFNPLDIDSVNSDSKIKCAGSLIENVLEQVAPEMEFQKRSLKKNNSTADRAFVFNFTVLDGERKLRGVLRTDFIAQEDGTVSCYLYCQRLGWPSYKRIEPFKLSRGYKTVLQSQTEM